MDEIKTTQATQDIEPGEDLFVVDAGSREIPVWDTLHQRIGTLRYNPTDLNMVNRFNEVAEKFDKILAPFTDANGTGDGEDSVKIMNEATEKLIEALDYVLASDSRAAFFSVVNPFSPTDGVFYCERVMDQLGNFITKVFGAEATKLNRRVANQTHGYRSGKHAKGKQ